MHVLESLWEGFRAGLTLLLILTALVAVHELGHHWFARLFGMEVKVFAVMMGGLRRTDLHPHLRQPLLPKLYVWLAIFASLAVFLLGALLKNDWIARIGFAFLAVPIPIWLTLRLERLYHLTPGQGLKYLGIGLAIGLALLFFGTQSAGFANIDLVLAVLFGGAICSLCYIYYIPTIQKSEDTEMGHGRIQTDTGEEIPVIYRPLLAKKDRHGTEYALLLLPLGGFAAIKGMTPQADGSEVYIDKGFYSKGPWQRLMVLFAGPLFSMLFGIFLLIGLYTTMGERKASTVIGGVLVGGAADKAGLKVGDKIVDINGEPVSTFVDMQSKVRFSYEETGAALIAQPLMIGFEREGTRQQVQVTPELTETPEFYLVAENKPSEDKRRQARLQIEPKSLLVPVAFGDALGKAFIKPVEMAEGLLNMVRKPQNAGDNLGGPASLAKVSQQASGDGIYSVLMLAAALSISLGVMNLLPIPPLDGGHILVGLIEIFRRGKRLPYSLQSSLSMVGVGFVLLLMMGAAMADLGREAAPKKLEKEIRRSGE